MSSDEENKEQGVRFGSLADDLEGESYPMSASELFDEYGDRKIELQDGEQTLEEVLRPLGETTFESAEDIKQDVIGLVSDEAVGRKNYTDRGGMPNEDGRSEESL